MRPVHETCVPWITLEALAPSSTAFALSGTPVSESNLDGTMIFNPTREIGTYSHVANGAHASARERVNAGAKVFDNCSSATLDSSIRVRSSRRMSERVLTGYQQPSE